MTADLPGTDGAAVGSRLDTLGGDATAEQLAVYTAIAGELAARLDEGSGERILEPKPSVYATPRPGPPTDGGEPGGEHGAVRG